jgi:hypothetical protein
MGLGVAKKGMRHSLAVSELSRRNRELIFWLAIFGLINKY